jgi:hypothetical protein
MTSSARASTIRPTVLDGDILPLSEAAFLQPFVERINEMLTAHACAAVEEPNHWCGGLLPIRIGPSRHATDERNEILVASPQPLLAKPIVPS